MIDSRQGAFRVAAVKRKKSDLDKVLGLLLDTVDLVLEDQPLASKKRDVEVLAAVASSKIASANFNSKSSAFGVGTNKPTCKLWLLKKHHFGSRCGSAVK
jgi:hypothetical protein